MVFSYFLQFKSEFAIRGVPYWVVPFLGVPEGLEGLHRTIQLQLQLLLITAFSNVFRS